MTRTHRDWHRTIWIILAIVVGAGFVLALALRPAPAATASPVFQERLQ
jgi:uncharacterized protein involved in exopolysaccharide biosynthesis